MTIDVHVHIHGDPRLDEVIRLLKAIEKKEDHMADTLDDLVQAAQDENTVDDSLLAIVTQLQASQSDPAKISAILAAMKANIAKVSAAVTANTPAAPLPPPAA